MIAITLDVMDAAGQHQNNVERSILKTRLDPTGTALGPFKGTTYIFFGFYIVLV